MLPGKGVGAIRFGANVATIERLMEFPCEVKTESLCGYNGRAVDFTLTDGVVSEIHVHRSDRANAHLAEAKYGVFNGRLLDGASLGMLQTAAMEILGAAQRVEQVKDGGPWGTVERHFFPDMTVEYDRLPNGNVVLGGVILTSPTAPAAASSASAKVPAAKVPAPAPAGSSKAK
jgi:hypothetical protein